MTNMKRSFRPSFWSRKSSDRVQKAGAADAKAPPQSGSTSLTVPLTSPDDTSAAVPQANVIEIEDSDTATASTIQVTDPPAEGPRPEKPDLWKLAFERAGFDEEQKKILLQTTNSDSEAWSPLDFVQNTKELTRARCVECEKSRWTTDNGAGKLDATRQAEKVLMAVLQLKEFVSQGLKFDVTGYGATAWSVVTFGLQLVQNDLDRTQLLFGASAFLADILVRYASIELYYGDPIIDDWLRLQDCIIGVYAAVLLYALEVKKALASDKTRRVVASFRALVEQPLQALKQSVSEQDESTGKWINQIAHQYRINESAAIREEISTVLSQVSHVAEQVQDTHRLVTFQEENTIREWFYRGLKGKHENIQADLSQYNGKLATGTWFLEHENFLKWKKYPQQMMWLYGNAGCGKSYLCSKVIDDLIATYRKDTRKCVVYWLFDSTTSDDLDTILRALIKQLLLTNKSIPSEVRSFYEEHFAYPPSTDKLASLFQFLLKETNRDVFLVLDGLDQCGQSYDSSERASFCTLLNALIREASNNLHLLLSSRHDPYVINSVAGNSHSFVIMDGTRNFDKDVVGYIDYHMESIPLLKNADSQFRENIESQLHTYDRLFQWTAACIRELCQCRDREQISAALYPRASLPETVERFYAVALRSISNNSRVIARALFQLLLSKPSNLACTEDQALDYAEIDVTSDIIDVCTSTLIHIDLARCIEFAHPTVIGYLEGIPGTAPPEIQYFKLDKDQANLNVGLNCLLYLSSGKTGPFEELALSLWSSSFDEKKALFAHESVPGVLEKAAQILSNPTPGLASRQYWRYFFKERPKHCQEKENPPPLYWIVDMFRGEQLALRMLECQPSACNLRGSKGTLLQLAIIRHRLKLAKRLLELNADVNAQPGPDGDAPYLAIMHLLPGRPMPLFNEPNSRLRVVKREYRVHPQVAVLQKALTDLILTRMEEPDKVRGYLGTVLQLASYYGNVWAVEKLLDCGANANATGGILGDALQAAACRGNGEVIELLISRGASTCQQHGLFGTAALAAQLGDHTRAEAILRSAGVDTWPNEMCGRLWWKALGETRFSRHIPIWQDPNILVEWLSPLQVKSKVNLGELAIRHGDLGGIHLNEEQRFTAVVRQLVTPSMALDDLMKLNSHATVVETGLLDQIESAFDGQADFTLKDHRAQHDVVTPYYAWKHLFRASVHAFFIKITEINTETAELLSYLMAIWYRTDIYEACTIKDTNPDDQVTKLLEDTVVALFEQMLRALSQIYHRFNMVCPGETDRLPVDWRSLVDANLEPYDCLKDRIGKLEEHVHCQASRYMQWKQVTMLEDMRREQAAMAKKIDEIASSLARVQECAIEDNQTEHEPIGLTNTPERPESE